MDSTTETKPLILKRTLATFLDWALFLVIFIPYYKVYAIQNPEDGSWSLKGLPALGSMMIWVIYFPIAEYKFGNTLGHYLLKLRVYSLSTDNLTFIQTFKRRLCDMIDIQWCFGLLAIILIKNTEKHQRLGDIWAKTIVGVRTS
jgi:uncharacterized RDD family membrane protein YckC